MIDKFLQFEKHNLLFEKKIRSINYWHLIRFSIYNELIEKNQPIGQAHTKPSSRRMGKRIFSKFKQIPNCITKNPLYFTKSSDILIFNHQRRVKNGLFYDCIYTDPLIKSFGYTYSIIEEPYLERHYKPVSNQNIKYTDYIDLKVGIIRRLKKNNIFNNEDIEELKNLVTLINKEFTMELDIHIWVEKISSMIELYYYRYKYYDKLIKKVNPKVILEVVSYGGLRFLINDIAKKRKIPTIELQHGTMGKYHVAYNFAEKIKLDTFPQYEFLFGPFWKEYTRFPIKDDKIKIVGWPYLEEKVKEYKSKNLNNNDSRKKILFISQGTIGKELSKIAVEISKKLDKKKYMIIYKLHPGEYDRWKKEYPWLLDAGLEVIDNNENDIHHFFAQADIQIGVYSTALFEGLKYGLKTYICKLYGYEFMEELYNNNLAILVDNYFEISEDIINNNKTLSNIDENYFWQNNSMKRIIKEIDIIIKENDKLAISK